MDSYQAQNFNEQWNTEPLKMQALKEARKQQELADLQRKQRAKSTLGEKEKLASPASASPAIKSLGAVFSDSPKEVKFKEGRLILSKIDAKFPRGYLTPSQNNKAKAGTSKQKVSLAEDLELSNPEDGDQDEEGPNKNGKTDADPRKDGQDKEEGEKKVGGNKDGGERDGDKDGDESQDGDKDGDESQDGDESEGGDESEDDGEEDVEEEDDSEDNYLTLRKNNLRNLEVWDESNPNCSNGEIEENLLFATQSVQTNLARRGVKIFILGLPVAIPESEGIPMCDFDMVQRLKAICYEPLETVALLQNLTRAHLKKDTWDFKTSRKHGAIIPLSIHGVQALRAVINGEPFKRHQKYLEELEDDPDKLAALFSSGKSMESSKFSSRMLKKPYLLENLRGGWRLVLVTLLRTCPADPQLHTWNVLAYVPKEWRFSHGISDIQDAFHVPVSNLEELFRHHWDGILSTFSMLEKSKNNFFKLDVPTRLVQVRTPRHEAVYETPQYYDPWKEEGAETAESDVAEKKAKGKRKKKNVHLDSDSSLTEEAVGEKKKTAKRKRPELQSSPDAPGPVKISEKNSKGKSLQKLAKKNFIK
jgi:hypothetical protein